MYVSLVKSLKYYFVLFMYTLLFKDIFNQYCSEFYCCERNISFFFKQNHSNRTKIYFEFSVEICVFSEFLEICNIIRI